MNKGIPRTILLVIIALLSCNNIFAQGDLLISPLRIVFEGPKRSQEINLANVGKDTATYVISVKDYRMNEDGSFEEVTVPDSGQRFAAPYLRFFPRKVTLAPNEAQVVKIQLIKTNELLPGEYRSHLYFRAVPDERPLGERPSKKDSGSISIQLTPIFGITIPCIIRVGDYGTTLAINNLSFDMSSGKPVVSMALTRNGNMSVYGDMKVDYISPEGKTTLVKTVKGVGIYTPKPIRRFSAELDGDKKGVDYHKGKLHVIYTMQLSDKATKTVEAEIVLK